jgi:dissimilatory sulfite reductase (desulfoviridin) alpha/beta subunit
MKYSNDNFEASKFLGNAVGKNNPFMRKIACMGQEWRDITALLDVLKIWAPEMTKQEKEDFKKLSDTVEKIGQADFKMDIVSHLSMKANADEVIADAH